MANFFLELAAATNVRNRQGPNPELRETVAIDRRVDQDVRSRRVKGVYFIGSETVTPPVTLHWRLFFILSGDRHESVEFNSQQLQMGSKNTRLYISYRDYEYSTRSVVRGNFYTPFARNANVTVQNIIQLLVHNNSRDRFKLSSGGSGCRCWCLTVMHDLGQAGYVAAGSDAAIEEGIQVLHRSLGQQWIPYPMHLGTFYE
ncbi:hypothetical protein C8R46DRAFT_1189986 [Mycena filopes]|nr:hypothetical protein C8R46DRAFT_1189986 [Mycena filopes]